MRGERGSSTTEPTSNDVVLFLLYPLIPSFLILKRILLHMKMLFNHTGTTFTLYAANSDAGQKARLLPRTNQWGEQC